MTEPSKTPGPPPLYWTLLEGRAVLEYVWYSALAPKLAPRNAPAGAERPVLVLPGFGASDGSTAVLRRHLRAHGFRAHGWGLGRNRGPSGRIKRGLVERLHGLHERYGHPVSLVGWSLGGVYARELARHFPGRVRQVITLGSPFAAGRGGTSIGWLYERVTGRPIDPGEAASTIPPPPVRATAIYSRSDGICHWRGCRETDAPHTENIEVEGSHGGLGHNPAVLIAVVDRLLQDPADWRPFAPRGRAARLYPEHRHRRRLRRDA